MRPKAYKRRGLTLLEMIIASSMLAVLVTAVSVVLRTGRQAWEAHEGDFTRLEALHSVLRHIVRQARSAASVAAITSANDAAGRLDLNMTDGTLQAWSRDNNDLVWFGVNTPNQLLADKITGLRFEGFRADGVTATTAPDLIHCLKITADVLLPRETGGARSVSSYVWIRSW